MWFNVGVARLDIFTIATAIISALTLVLLVLFMFGIGRTLKAVVDGGISSIFGETPEEWGRQGGEASGVAKNKRSMMKDMVTNLMDSQIPFMPIIRMLFGDTIDEHVEKNPKAVLAMVADLAPLAKSLMGSFGGQIPQFMTGNGGQFQIPTSE